MSNVGFDDSVGRLISRLDQMIPGHVRIVDFVIITGPIIAAWDIKVSQSDPSYVSFAAAFSAYFDEPDFEADAHSLDASPIVSSSEVTITNTNVLEEFLIGDDPIISGAWTATGLWHVTTYRSSTEFRSFNYGHNDVGVAGAGGSNPPDYNTGVSNSGDLTSPTVPGIAAATSVTFRFRQRINVESGVVKDLPSVSILSVPALTPLVTFNKTALGLASGTTGGSFVTFSSNITGAVVGAGDFKIVFSFDTIDANNNNTECWYIDDVEVQVIP